MKNKLGYLGLLGIPLALLGVVTSVALAASTPTPVVPVDASITQAPTADNDVETNDDSKVAASEVKDEKDANVETNDDADGLQEAPDTETAD